MRAGGVVILVCPVLALAACGPESSRQAAPPQLPRAVAERLAGESDALASTLARDDACGARERFHRLERHTRAAIVSADVPVTLRSPLLTAVHTLGRRLPRCTPPPPPPPPPPPSPEPDQQQHRGRGKEKPGKGPKKEHGKKQHGEKGR